jgi:hypothetical protein
MLSRLNRVCVALLAVAVVLASWAAFDLGRAGAACGPICNEFLDQETFMIKGTTNKYYGNATGSECYWRAWSETAGNYAGPYGWCTAFEIGVCRIETHSHSGGTPPCWSSAVTGDWVEASIDFDSGAWQATWDKPTCTGTTTCYVNP